MWIYIYISKLNKIFVMSEVSWIIFQSLSYSMSLSFSHIVLVNYLTKSDDLTQTSLPTQQIDNIGFVLGGNFWLTSHRSWESLAYIKESTGRSKILILHQVFMYPCDSITLFHAKHKKGWSRWNFLAYFFKLDIPSRLWYFLVFQQWKYFPVRLALYILLDPFSDFSKWK